MLVKHPHCTEMGTDHSIHSAASVLFILNSMFLLEPDFAPCVPILVHSNTPELAQPLPLVYHWCAAAGDHFWLI